MITDTCRSPSKTICFSHNTAWAQIYGVSSTHPYCTLAKHPTKNECIDFFLTTRKIFPIFLPEPSDLYVPWRGIMARLTIHTGSENTTRQVHWCRPYSWCLTVAPVCLIGFPNEPRRSNIFGESYPLAFPFIPMVGAVTPEIPKT